MTFSVTDNLCDVLQRPYVRPVDAVRIDVEVSFRKSLKPCDLRVDDGFLIEKGFDGFVVAHDLIRSVVCFDGLSICRVYTDCKH